MSENIQMASMPIEDYKSACDTIREITNSSEVITSGELAKKVEEVYDCDWNKLKDSASGEIISINDMSPIEHEMSVKVRGKNLIDYTKAEPKNATQTVVINEENKSVVWSGNFYFVIPLGTTIKAGTVITFSCTSNDFYRLGFPNKENIDDIRMSINVNTGDGEVYLTETLPVDIEEIYIYKKSVQEIKNDMVFANIQLELGTTATSYAPYIPDISAVRVSKYGKNLFKLEKISVANGTIIEELENGAIVSGNASTNPGNSSWANGWFTPNDTVGYMYLKKESTVYISADITWLNIDNYAENSSFGFYLYDAKTNSGSLAYHREYPTNSTINKTFRIVAQIKISESGKYYPVFTLNSCTMKIENIQISFDENEIYEPYIEPTEYISDADGVVSGVTSLYPSTTLMTDTDGVIIDATYNKAISNVDDVPERIEAVYKEGVKSEYDKFWDTFQKNGTRRDYSYAFCYDVWTDNIFSPKYDIDFGNGRYDNSLAFYKSTILDIVACLEKNNVKIITSQAPILEGTFQAMKSSTLPVIDMSSCTSATLAFYNTSLKKLSITNLREDCKLDRTFDWNTNLEEFNITGIIGQNGFDVSQSKKLSKASWVNIIGCLSTTTSGLSITGSLDSIKKAFETSPGANDGDTSTEWLELETSRSNWKINLL